MDNDNILSDLVVCRRYCDLPSVRKAIQHLTSPSYLKYDISFGFRMTMSPLAVLRINGFSSSLAVPTCLDVSKTLLTTFAISSLSIGFRRKSNACSRKALIIYLS